MAPEGYEFVDEEEEYIVSKDGKSGSWQPYHPGRIVPTSDAPSKKASKRQSKKKGKSVEPSASADNAAGRPQLADEKRATPSQSQAEGMSIEDI